MGVELPRIPELAQLYADPWNFRIYQGMFLEIAGRSGSGKSLLAMWIAQRMGVSALYFSADMNRNDWSSRLAACITGDTYEMVQAAKERGDFDKYATALESSKLMVAPQSPIRWANVEREIEAYVEVFDTYPQMFIFDNLMDFENAEFDYGVQMEAMSVLTELARDTGSTVLVLHHATDKTQGSPLHLPPSRDQIKNGLAEKPERILTVAMDEETNRFRVALVKNRGGKTDAGARHPISLLSEPGSTRFHRWEE